jgi:hypothetical protein
VIFRRRVLTAAVAAGTLGFGFGAGMAIANAASTTPSTTNPTTPSTANPSSPGSSTTPTTHPCPNM